MPKVIIFDLDETLFFAKFKKNPGDILSKSAEMSLSSSSEGIGAIKDVEDSKKTIHASIEVTAIERQRMKQFFAEVYEVIKMAREKDQPVPIAIKIMTSGLYEERHVRDLFNQFYALEDGPVFFTEKFPIEHFNRKKYDEKLQIEFNEFYKSRTLRHEPHNNPLLQKYATANSAFSDPRKAMLISLNEKKWLEQMPGLELKDIVLFDNANYNIFAVQDKGYSFIHYPTTPQERHESQRFSDQKDQAFAQLSDLVQSEKNALLNKSPRVARK